MKASPIQNINNSLTVLFVIIGCYCHPGVKVSVAPSPATKTHLFPNVSQGAKSKKSDIEFADFCVYPSCLSVCLSCDLQYLHAPVQFTCLGSFFQLYLVFLKPHTYKHAHTHAHTLPPMQTCSQFPFCTHFQFLCKWLLHTPFLLFFSVLFSFVSEAGFHTMAQCIVAVIKHHNQGSLQEKEFI